MFIPQVVDGNCLVLCERWHKALLLKRVITSRFLKTVNVLRCFLLLQILCDLLVFKIKPSVVTMTILMPQVGNAYCLVLCGRWHKALE